MRPIRQRLADDEGEKHLVQTSKPVNRYPDFVRHLVRQLKRTFPAIGHERIAQILAREGLVLGVSTIARMVCEPSDDTRPSEIEHPARRRAVGRKPGDVWHVDLTCPYQKPHPPEFLQPCRAEYTPASTPIN